MEIDLQGLHHTRTSSRRKLRQENGELWSFYNNNPAKLADVWCLKLCAATLFVLLLKVGAVLSIICGFLMAVSCWRCILQCVIIVRSFLRLLKLRKVEVCKLDLSRGGLTRCHSVLDHGLNLNRNIPFKVGKVILVKQCRFYVSIF